MCDVVETNSARTRAKRTMMNAMLSRRGCFCSEVPYNNSLSRCCNSARIDMSHVPTQTKLRLKNHTKTECIGTNGPLRSVMLVVHGFPFNCQPSFTSSKPHGHFHGPASAVFGVFHSPRAAKSPKNHQNQKLLVPFTVFFFCFVPCHTICWQLICICIIWVYA